MIAAANELAACIGFSEADRNTFTGPTHKDAEGAQYCVASGPVMAEFVQDAVSPLVEPLWGADMDKAEAAQAAIRVWTEDAPVIATPDTIAAIVLEDVGAALEALGLVRLDLDETPPEAHEE